MDKAQGAATHQVYRTLPLSRPILSCFLELEDPLELVGIEHDRGLVAFGLHDTPVGAKPQKAIFLTASQSVRLINGPFQPRDVPEIEFLNSCK